jgi:hypothetical protein
MSKSVKTHTFNGRRHEIILDADGICVQGENVLEVSPHLKGLKLLETTLHEALHASKFDKRETLVLKTAKDVSRFLWRLGYRIVKK